MNPVRILKAKWFPPAERKEPFTGQVVLITGANTGIGLEAAKKIAALKADKLIITTRSAEKGESARKAITEWLVKNGASQATQIVSLTLDMGSSEGVKAFMKQLHANTDRLNSAILNAGMQQPQYRRTLEGFEETLAVNTVYTTFLATLLLPILTSTAKSTDIQTHLTIISSRNATMPISMPTKPAVISSSAPLKVMSEPEEFPPGGMGGFAQYGRSKLMLEYAIRRMIHLSTLYSNNKEPLVVINSVCPGVTKSDLGRSYDHWTFRLLSAIIFLLFAKPAAAGANSYLTALSQGADSMGQLWADDALTPEWTTLQSADGQKLGDNVWNEMKTLMESWDGSLSSILKDKP